MADLGMGTGGSRIISDAIIRSSEAFAVGAKDSGLGNEIVRTDLKIGTDGSPIISDTMNRPSKAFAVGGYAGAGSIEDDNGAYAGAGVGHIQWSDGQAKGPNASAGAEFSSARARVFTKAEVASVSVSNGPVKATVGLSADTGIGIGEEGVEAKVLGTGITIGRKIGFSVLGSGVEFKLW